MIKILGPKKTDRVEEEKKQEGGQGEKKLATAGKLRVSKDLAQLDLPANAAVKIPNKDDIMKLDVTVKPEEGSYWYGGTYNFTMDIPDDYPQAPPKITCNTKVNKYNPDSPSAVSLVCPLCFLHLNCF